MVHSKESVHQNNALSAELKGGGKATLGWLGTSALHEACKGFLSKEVLAFIAILHNPHLLWFIFMAVLGPRQELPISLWSRKEFQAGFLTTLSL